MLQGPHHSSPSNHMYCPMHYYLEYTFLIYTLNLPHAAGASSLWSKQSYVLSHALLMGIHLPDVHCSTNHMLQGPHHSDPSNHMYCRMHYYWEYTFLIYTLNLPHAAGASSLWSKQSYVLSHALLLGIHLPDVRCSTYHMLQGPHHSDPSNHMYSHIHY